VCLFTLQDLVLGEMAATYGPDHVAAVNVVQDTSKLAPILARYNNAKGSLDDMCDDIIGKVKRGDEVKGRKQVRVLWRMLWLCRQAGSKTAHTVAALQPCSVV
jgi:hypothetical protein